MPKTDLALKEQAPEKYCKTCLQNDYFDFQTKRCSRCSLEKKENAPSPTQYKFSPQNNLSSYVELATSILFTALLALIFFGLIPLLYDGTINTLTYLVLGIISLLPIAIKARKILQTPNILLEPYISKITESQGLFLLRNKKSYFLSDIDFLEISPEKVLDQNGNTIKTIFPIKAYFKKTTTSEKYQTNFILINKPEKYFSALLEAKKLARYLNIELKDIASNSPKTYSIYELGHNLATQLINNEVKPTFPIKEPLNNRIQYDIEPYKSTSIFALPANGFVAYGAMFLTIIGGFMIFELLQKYFFTTNEIMFLLVSAIAIAICCIKVKEVVLITPTSFLLEKHFLFRSKQLLEIPLSELNEIKLEEKPFSGKDGASLFTIYTLYALSDKQAIVFGKELKDEEPKWLSEAIKHSIYEKTKNSDMVKESKLPNWE